MDGITRFRPHVVHFSGHGSEHLIAFEQDVDASHDQPALVSAEAFAQALSATDDPPRLVLLNSCDSAAQIDQLVTKVTPFAIGMTEEIEDGDAITYATQFYAAVANGQSILAATMLERPCWPSRVCPVKTCQCWFAARVSMPAARCWSLRRSDGSGGVVAFRGRRCEPSWKCRRVLIQHRRIQHMSAPGKYDQEFRKRAVRMYQERLAGPGESSAARGGRIKQLPSPGTPSAAPTASPYCRLITVSLSNLPLT
jgi:hypothetical protein